MPKAVKEEVVLVSLSLKVALGRPRHFKLCNIVCWRLAGLLRFVGAQSLGCFHVSQDLRLFFLQLVVASPRGEADIRRPVGTLS